MKKESTASSSFRFFPEERLQADFSWQSWAVGLLLFLKTVLWFSTDPNIADDVLKILGLKYILFMVPSVFLGFGIWNLRRWAAWGILFLSVFELLFFLLYPASLSSLRLDQTSTIATILSFFVFLINGPVSDLFILFSLPALFKHTKSSPDQYAA